MDNIPDHPVIKSCERYGYPDGDREEKIPICPECGKEAEEFYVNKYDEILGCNYCVKAIDSWRFYI